jgi:tetratricopeptide (TPR) repeat protein
MKNLSPLTKKAIEAAHQQNWTQAIEINEEILKEKPQEIGALNRLALARMQLGHIQIAEKILKKILEIDRRNKIAQKNLKKVQNKEKGQAAQIEQRSSYIVEPGKAKVIELSRLSDKTTLQNLAVGQACTLDPKKAYVSVNSKDGQYIGTLPKDISERLIKLIKTGNTYSCQIHSIKEDCLKIHIKEASVAPENKGVLSFPLERNTSSVLSEELAADFQIRDDVPLEIVDTDEDDEPSEDDLDDFEEN